MNGLDPIPHPPIVEMVKRCFRDMQAPVSLCDPALDTLWQNPYLERQCPQFFLRSLRELSQECDWPQVEAQLRRGQEVLLQLPSLFSGEGTASVRLLPCLDDGALEAVFALFPAPATAASPLELEGAQRVAAAFSQSYRTKLTAIFSALPPLARRLEESGDYAGQQLVERVNQSAYRLLRISRNVEEIAKYQSGNNPFLPQPLDMGRFLENLCEGVRLVMGRSGIPFTSQIQLDGVQMQADQGKLEQALTNLLSNAFLYTRDQNAVHLDARLIGGEVVITVRDRGRGIEPALQAKVFEPYFSHGPDGGFPSTGLGLTLCRYAVALHGGRVLLQSTPGEGTTVKCILPVRESAEDPVLRSESPFELLQNRYSALYVELADVCQLPYA